MLCSCRFRSISPKISNNIDTTVYTEAEVMALNVSGLNGSTTLYLVEEWRGKQGCNLTGQTTLGLTVASSNTSRGQAQR